MNNSQSLTYDDGLRIFFQSIYNNMGLGLLIGGASALATATFAPALLTGWSAFLIVLLPLAIIFALSFGQEKMSVSIMRTLYWAFIVSQGISLGYIFLVYQMSSIISVFLITSIMFLGASLYGYTTQRDLSSLGSFLIMGLFGLIAAIVVNIFLGSAMITWIISIAAVGIFTVLTATDTNMLKSYYYDYGYNEKAVLMGAISLYLNFVNIFVYLLQLIGEEK